jgi:NAD(P)-dependent dehydrogenase (short-subunit alcohol dehydrogenase family)
MTKFTTQHLDITDRDAIIDLFKTHAPIHVVANCAGILESDNKIVDGRASDFQENVDVHITGLWNLASAFLNYTSVPVSSQPIATDEGSLSGSPVFVGFNSLLAHFPATQVMTAPASYAVTKIAAAKLIE